MKRFIFYSIALLSIIFISYSCKEVHTPSSIKRAKAYVHVNNLQGMPQSEMKVFMFRSKVDSETTPETAVMSAVSGKNGVAEFDIDLTAMNIFESQTTLSFAVFYIIEDDYYIAYSSGMTIKEGEEKNSEITIPIE